MKNRIKDNQAQLLLVTAVLLATTILIIGEVATHVVTLGIESSLEKSHSLAREYVIIKDKFLLAFKENVKLLDKYYENFKSAINNAFEKTIKEFGDIEAYYGIIFIADLKNITPKGNRKFDINITLKMKDSTTYIEEDMQIEINFFASDEWWKNDKIWNFRIPVIVKTTKVDALIGMEINFTKEVEKFGNSSFDENSIRILEYNENGKILWEVPYQFNKDSAYDLKKNALGKILWFANGSSNEKRYYYIYFDTIENGVKNKTNYSALLQNPIITKRTILEDNLSIYNFTPHQPQIIANRISGNNSFNSNGSCYFEKYIGSLGKELHYISFWLYFNNSHADILFGVQINNNTWAGWGFDSDEIYNGADWNNSIIGNTTNVSYGTWNYFKIDLIEDLNISKGSNITGVAFYSDNVFYDHLVFEDIMTENVEKLNTMVYEIL